MPDCNRTLPVRIDLRLTEDERQYLNDEAETRGISRQDLLRRLVLAPAGETADLPACKPVVVSHGRRSIDRAMAAVARQYNCIPSHQLEPLVCTVICALTEQS
jgi:hypothetical protein